MVEEATTQQAMLVLEDLTGIRERTNQDPRPKRKRRHSNSWAFSQLREFVTYKAALASVLLVLHPPAYSCVGSWRVTLWVRFHNPRV